MEIVRSLSNLEQKLKQRLFPSGVFYFETFISAACFMPNLYELLYLVVFDLFAVDTFGFCKVLVTHRFVTWAWTTKFKLLCVWPWTTKRLQLILVQETLYVIYSIRLCKLETSFSQMEKKIIYLATILPKLLLGIFRVGQCFLLHFHRTGPQGIKKSFRFEVRKFVLHLAFQFWGVITVYVWINLCLFQPIVGGKLKLPHDHVHFSFALSLRMAKLKCALLWNCLV